MVTKMVPIFFSDHSVIPSAIGLSVANGNGTYNGNGIQVHADDKEIEDEQPEDFYFVSVAATDRYVSLWYVGNLFVLIHTKSISSGT